MRPLNCVFGALYVVWASTPVSRLESGRVSRSVTLATRLVPGIAAKTGDESRFGRARGSERSTRSG